MQATILCLYFDAEKDSMDCAKSFLTFCTNPQVPRSLQLLARCISACSMLIARSSSSAEEISATAAQGLLKARCISKMISAARRRGLPRARNRSIIQARSAPLEDPGACTYARTRIRSSNNGLHRAYASSAA